MNDKFIEIDKKFKIILGDSKINKNEEKNDIKIEKNNDINIITKVKDKDTKRLSNNIQEQTKKEKVINLSDINKRLAQLNMSKLSILDFDSKAEIIVKKINEIESKVKLISNAFGLKKDNIDELQIKKQVNFATKNDFERLKNKSELEFIKIWEEINNLKKLYDEIINKTKDITSLNDLENMRDLILQKIEELFIKQNKKYENNFLALNILQEQFKKLLELLALKEEEEKGNWLITKKPNGGHSCASCENYLGELKNDKNKFIHLNKLPFRERDSNGEKFYRVGNGYSRLLQMVNFDNNGNVILNPFSNNNGNNNNINNIENNKSNDLNKSLSGERINSTSRSKKGSKERNKSIDIIQSRNDENKLNKRLPEIKCSMSSDNFEKLYNNNIRINNPNISIGGNNTSYNFQNSKIMKILKKNQSK